MVNENPVINPHDLMYNFPANISLQCSVIKIMINLFILEKHTLWKFLEHFNPADFMKFLKKFGNISLNESQNFPHFW